MSIFWLFRCLFMEYALLFLAFCGNLKLLHSI
nr:MAG TPA: hypothetical protein [Caudoviricetes sp.]